MFKIDGSVDVTVIEAFVSEPKFDAKPNEVNNRNEYVQVYYDVCLLLQDKDGNTDTWFGEISNRTGSGTKAHLYRLDLTLETLQEIGFNVQTLNELEQQFVAAADRTITILNLVGIKCSAMVAKSDKTDRNGNPYYNVKYLNKIGGGNRKMTMEEIMARRTGQTAPAAAPAAPASPAAPPAAYPQQPVQQYAQPQPQQAPVQYAQPAAAPQGYPPAAYPQQNAAPAAPPAAPAAPGAPAKPCPY